MSLYRYRAADAEGREALTGGPRLGVVPRAREALCDAPEPFGVPRGVFCEGVEPGPHLRGAHEHRRGGERADEEGIGPLMAALSASGIRSLTSQQQDNEVP